MKYNTAFVLNPAPLCLSCYGIEKNYHCTLLLKMGSFVAHVRIFNALIVAIVFCQFACETLLSGNTRTDKFVAKLLEYVAKRASL